MTRNPYTPRRHPTTYNNLHRGIRATWRNLDDGMKCTRTDHHHSHKQIDYGAHSMCVGTCVPRLNMYKNQKYTWTTKKDKNNGVKTISHRLNRMDERGLRHAESGGGSKFTHSKPEGSQLTVGTAHDCQQLSTEGQAGYQKSWGTGIMKQTQEALRKTEP